MHNLDPVINIKVCILQ